MSVTETKPEKIASQLSAQANAMEQRRNGSKPGNFAFGSMASTVDVLLNNVITQKYGDNFACERSAFAEKITGSYWACLSRYAAWSNPANWSVDFVDQDGSFGIIFTGEYTCMVMARADGSVSGHS